MENRIEDLLPRITALEDLFNSPPGDTAEHRRRNELIRYALILLLRQALISS